MKSPILGLRTTIYKVADLAKAKDYYQRCIVFAESNGETDGGFYLFANANLAAIPLLESSITADPAIYPPENVRNTLFGEQPLPLRALRERTRAWANFRNQP